MHSGNDRSLLAAEAPLRAELLPADRLGARAREIAREQVWAAEGPTETPLIGMVDAAAASLQSDNAVLAEAVRLQHPIAPASEWLLDNYYLIEEQIRMVREDLPASYGEELPTITEGPFRGYPRIFPSTLALIAHTDARPDEEYLLRFVDGLQDEAPLTIGEVWAIPIMLRAGLVENVRRLSRRVVIAHRSGRLADTWADRLLLTAQDDPSGLHALIGEIDSAEPEDSSTFYLRLSQRLSGQDVGTEDLNAWLARSLDRERISLDVLSHEQQQVQAADQVSIANSITAIRFLDAYEWRSFFETCSFVEQILRQDPVGVYRRMDFKSRDRYRHALEAMARRCPMSEIEVAEATISLCLQSLADEPSDTVAGHVGTYLISSGRPALEGTIGYRLTRRERRYRGPLSHRGLFYWGTLSASTLAFMALLAWFLVWADAPPATLWAALALGLIPISQLGMMVTNRVAAWAFPPRALPRLDHRLSVSDANRTLVVVPALMSSVGAVRSVLDNLEVAYLANRDENIALGILGDLKGGPEQHADGDAVIIEAAIGGVETLNERYLAEHGRAPFYAFIRERVWDEREGAWMGWERKRGALAELNHALRGSTETTFSDRIGEGSFLESVTFVLTLDADTVLPRDAARRLISTIAHPLNRAALAPGDTRVHTGYGLMQPRVSMTLTGAGRSRFAQLYSGATGIDPYAGAVSDTYQDVFGEGSFTGKGIYEVGVFNAVLDGAFPDDTLLSHDLLEGNYLRVALASDIEVLDDHPDNYLSHMARLHRWIRGDWQTTPWLFPRVPLHDGSRGRNPLSALQRWKIVDNLRRSLVAPATVLLIAVGWLLPGSPWAWPLLIAGFLAFPVLFALANQLLSRPDEQTGSRRAAIARDFMQDVERAFLALSLMPYEAWVDVDAICRALWRMIVSRRGLLEWETAADADRRVGRDLSGYARRLGPAALVASVLLLPGTLVEPIRILPALALWLMWLSGPLVAWRMSVVRQPELEPLSAEETHVLRLTARRTWRFFETFVTAEDHWLAPDNFQEDPGQVVAHRTSPTNIGLQLLATLSAYDLGYLTLSGLVGSCSDTLNTMSGLERFRGHFYNWYDTRTLRPLPPNYISTVDSGNLAGSLLVLRLGLLEASEAPLLDRQLIEGFADTVSLAVEDLFVERDGLGPEPSVRAIREKLEEIARDARLKEAPNDLGGWHALLRRLDSLVESALRDARDLTDADDASDADEPGSGHPTTPSARVRDALKAVERSVGDAHSMLGELAPWAPLIATIPRAVIDDPRSARLTPLLEYVPSLVGLAEGLGEALEALGQIADHPPGASDTDRERSSVWARSVSDAIVEARPGCVELLARLRLDANIARVMWEHTDFRMLFDGDRLLFSIGYNTAEGRLDPSFYDLLASECRLASFLAIAKGDVPQEHWFRLGRAITSTGSGRALLSWSASMFEYLMPLLFMRTWPLTLLDQTYTSVVERQVSYAAERGVPWGISESAFNAKDAELTYQYQAFGVPGLGLKRGLSDDVVIAPYASVLALPVAPRAVLDNLKALAERGARGRYGYFESLDYTPGRIPAGAQRAVVKAYFAHHQGMSFLAMANELLDAPVRDRFHRDPMVSSAELLLQERVPRSVQLAHPHVEEVRNVRSVRELPAPITRSYPLADTPVPSTHFLSNGRYSVMVTNGGGGYSRWEGLAVSRYREDVTRDCWGQFFYIRDVESGTTWSATNNPAPSLPDEYFVAFSSDKAEFRRSDGEIETHTEVSVSPEDDVEVRRITITNRGFTPRAFEVTSYFEIALTEQAADQAHKSFSNLFVETDAHESTNTLLFSRRPRSAEEARVWGFHTLGCEAGELCEWSYESDRAKFLGRLRQAGRPRAVEEGGMLSGTTGAVLDPACAIRRGVRIGPGESARFVFSTGVARSRDAAVRLSEKYHEPHSAQRAIDLAWTAAQIELRDLGLEPAEAVVLQRLASRLLLTDPYSVLKVMTPAENELPISGLWSLGISGDHPILLVRIDELEHAPLVRQALLAHQYWRHKGLVADLVILNTRPTAYVDELDERLRLLVRTGQALQLMDKPGGVFLRRADQMHPDVLNLLLSVARATLDGDGGSIELQLNRRGKRPDDPPPLVPTRQPYQHDAPTLDRPDLLFDNGYGGFDPQTGEYVIVQRDGRTTPAPWINVMAFPEFGCMVTEAGIGCTWAKNSHENRISTWNNDPVSDGSGEAIYVRDQETGEFWSPTPLPIHGGEPYVVRHGKGYSRFEHTSHGIEQSLDWFVPVDDPVRIVRLRLKNLTDRTRKLTVTQFVEWVLGSSRSKAQHLVVTWYDAEFETLTAHNHYNMDFPGRSAFLASDRPLHSFTASRTEFVGRNRRPSDPAAMHRAHLDGRTGRSMDNCGALMNEIDLAPGEEQTVTFLLGQSDSLERSREIVAAYRDPDAVARAFDDAISYWEGVLSTVEVRTPDPALDAMVNGNALYQALACRLWGRTAAYQSSGAFGFRDQLQDSLAMMLAQPELVRAQIIEAARHQFEEGDVLHWWQPASGRGVRTRITDDRHWLPFVASEYIEATGDASVLDERVPYIEGPAVETDREDNYLQPTVSEKDADIYTHCVAALETGRPTGPHDLPLMGGGDWNDGMNRVGIGGTGESVWLAWFLSATLKRFVPICRARGDVVRAEEYRAWADRLVAAVEEHGWDGGWYRRAYFDDGTPLGSLESPECKIDAIAQAWATIAGGGDLERARRALDAVEEKLVRRDDGLIRLLSPPFDDMPHDPGYIKGYVPGVRENGGQYTHAAIWVILAYLLLGDGDEGHVLLSLINPINHARSVEAAERYKVEPYVVAADVYAAPPHVGRGGWTWYTGSAGWFYRVAVQYLLGMWTVERDGVRHLQIEPCIPKTWSGYSMTYRYGSTSYRIDVENPRGVNRGVARVELDGRTLDGHLVPLTDDGDRHDVRVTLLGG